jgi:hypothetical protein
MANLEIAIKNIQKKVIDYRSKSVEIFEGKNSLTGSSVNINNIKQTISDKGVIKILEVVASTDVCSILNFVSQQTTNYRGFDPDKQPPPSGSSSLQKNKYIIQKTAYKIQKSIDNYYAQNGEAVTVGSNAAFVQLVEQLYSDLLDLKNTSNTNDGELGKIYVIINLYNNFVSEMVELIQSLPIQNNSLGVNITSNSEILKLKNQIDNLRSICVSIQTIPDSPQDLAVYAFSAASPLLMEQIKSLNKIADPKKLIPLLTAITNTCKTLYQILGIIENSIRFSQFIVTISVTFIKIFSVISKFLEALSIPAMFSTSGLQTKLSSFNEKLKKYIDKFKGNIDQISIVLNNMASLVEYLLINLQLVLERLDTIRVNFSSCDNINDETLNNLDSTIANLKSANANLNKFLSNFKDKTNAINNSFGEYTLSIIEEKPVDDTVRFVRRYGIALDRNGSVVVNTNPTFATLDSVIYDEVKLKLISIGAIKPQSIDGQTQVSIDRASVFLEDSSLLQQIPSDNFDSAIDPPGNEDESDGIGLNAFINKLSGGKRLRKRVQDAMVASRRQLNSDLSLNSR